MIQLFQVGDRLSKGSVGFGILEIAEMLAERDLPPAEIATVFFRCPPTARRDRFVSI